MRVSIRTCVPNLGAVRRDRFLTIYNPLIPPGVGWVNIFIFVKVRVSIRTCVPNLGAIRRNRFLTIYNPLNPPGVGQFFFKVIVFIRTCVPNLGAIRRERFLTIYNPLNPPPRGGVGQLRAKFGRGPTVVSRNKWVNNPHNHTTTNIATSGIGSLNPPGVGWVNLFYFFKVRVSIRTCVHNLGAIRRSVRKSTF